MSKYVIIRAELKKLPDLVDKLYELSELCSREPMIVTTEEFKREHKEIVTLKITHNKISYKLHSGEGEATTLHELITELRLIVKNNKKKIENETMLDMIAKLMGESVVDEEDSPRITYKTYRE